MWWWLTTWTVGSGYSISTQVQFSLFHGTYRYGLDCRGSSANGCSNHSGRGSSSESISEGNILRPGNRGFRGDTGSAGGQGHRRRARNGGVDRSNGSWTASSAAHGARRKWNWEHRHHRRDNDGVI